MSEIPGGIYSHTVTMGLDGSPRFSYRVFGTMAHTAKEGDLTTFPGSDEFFIAGTPIHEFSKNAETGGAVIDTFQMLRRVDDGPEPEKNPDDLARRVFFAKMLRTARASSMWRKNMSGAAREMGSIPSRLHALERGATLPSETELAEIEKLYPQLTKGQDDGPICR